MFKEITNLLSDLADILSEIVNLLHETAYLLSKKQKVYNEIANMNS